MRDEVPDLHLEYVEWQKRAHCADDINPDRFFPKRGGSIASALRLCRACPVRAECLDFAVELQIDYGVWGGKTPPQRRALWTEAEAS